MDRSTFEIHEDHLGKIRFRLRAANDKVIAFGEGCKTKDECINGIKDVQQTVIEYHDAEIKDFTIGETTVILDKPQDIARNGSTIIFSGRLYGDPSGDGIEKAVINIYESDGSLLKETRLASGNTSVLGEFYIEWMAKKLDWWDNSIEVYAKFEGSTSLKPSHSKKHLISIS